MTESLPGDPDRYELGRKRAALALRDKPAGVPPDVWLKQKSDTLPTGNGNHADFHAGYNHVLTTVSLPSGDTHRFRPMLLQGYRTPSLRCACGAWDDDDNLPPNCPMSCRAVP